MQQKKPDDYVIATGKNYSVKFFIEKVAKYLDMKIKWKGTGINTKGYDKNGNCIIECDKSYYRPLELDTLLGDSKKAKKILNWKPKTSIEMLVKEMVDFELNN